MPAGVSFLQLEGNYVISFRDTSECLPAFTAVRLDRRRGSVDPGEASVAGDDSPRRRRGSQLTTFKLVITGVPAHVRSDVIKSRLEDSIPGIVRVYRDPDMARELTKPPVFIETKLAIALDAFMLRGEWVFAMQRLAKEGAHSLPNITITDEDSKVRFNLPDEEFDKEKTPAKDPKRRQSLVALTMTCPHGRYLARETCTICRHMDRRGSYVADNVVTHPATSKKKTSCPGMCIFGVFRRGAPMSPVDEDVPDAFLPPEVLASVKTQRRHSAFEVPVHDNDIAKPSKLI